MKYLIPIIILLLIAKGLLGQNKFFRSIEFYNTIGFAELDVEKFTQNENIDFLNYVDPYIESSNIGTIKLGSHLEFMERMSADINLVMLDDFLPLNYDISVHYQLTDFLAIGAGSIAYHDLVTGFEQYHIEYHSDYYLQNQNIRQFNFADVGFYITPVLQPFKNEKFRAVIKFDVGMSFFSFNKESSFVLKKKLSNELLQFDYKTKNSNYLFLNPKLLLKLRLFKTKTFKIGLMASTNYYFANRRIDYLRTTTVWTDNNAKNEHIKTQKHTYSRFEFDFGVYFDF